MSSARYMIRALAEQPDPSDRFGTRLELTVALDLATAPESAESVLVVFALIGVDARQEIEGTSPADALLLELRKHLEASLGATGAYYRSRADEVAALVPGSIEAVRPLLEGTLRSLAGTPLEAAAGVVVLPSEAADPTEALILADEQLHAAARARGARERRISTRR
jgi:GGDEF domain-containing protein